MARFMDSNSDLSLEREDIAIATSTFEFMPIPIALLSEGLLAKLTGEGAESAVGASVVLSTTQLGEFL